MSCRRRSRALAVRDESTESLRCRLEANQITKGQVNRFFVGSIDQCANSMLRNGNCEVLGIRPGYSIWSEDVG